MSPDLEAMFLHPAAAPLPGRRILICAVCAEWLASAGGGPTFRGGDPYWAQRVHLALGPETDFVRVTISPPITAKERCATCLRAGAQRLWTAVIEAVGGEAPAP